jgi:hypothetical protein
MVLVVAGFSEHVHAHHFYLSTCALNVGLDNSRFTRADARIAASQGRLSLNFQVYVPYTPQLYNAECSQWAIRL